MLVFFKIIIINKLKNLEKKIINNLYSRIEEDPNFVFHTALVFTFCLTVLILQLLFGQFPNYIKRLKKVLYLY